MSVLMPRAHVIEPPSENFSEDFTAAKKVTPTTFFLFKGALDRLLAAILLVPALPVLAFLCVLVKATSRGPAIFRQERVGKGGRIFTMYKIRSMDTNAEALTGPVWASARDPRVNRVGWWLRKLHLDEIPQLYNVLKGEMSLVGPRPERPEFTTHLINDVPGYEGRLTVRPGVTGLAQVNLPPDSDLDGVRRKLALDIEYIQTASWLLDTRIAFCTGFRLTGLSSARLVRMFGLERCPNKSMAGFAAREHAKGIGSIPQKPR